MSYNQQLLKNRLLIFSKTYSNLYYDFFPQQSFSRDLELSNKFFLLNLSKISSYIFNMKYVVCQTM